MTQSAASNISLQVGECQENILLPATDANAGCKKSLAVKVKKATAVLELCNRRSTEIYSKPKSFSPRAITNPAYVL